MSLRLVGREPPNPPPRRGGHAGSALTQAQQAKVKAVLRTLRVSFQGWGPLSAALGLSQKTADHLVNPRCVITGDVLIRTCKAGNLSVDAMLDNALTEAGRCRACGARRASS